MKAYELLFIIAPSTDEETRANTMNRIQGIITSAEGSVDNVDEWGKRKLAYEINDLTDFHADPAEVAELDRVLRISDVVVRHMIVKRTDRE